MPSGSPRWHKPGELRALGPSDRRGWRSPRWESLVWLVAGVALVVGLVAMVRILSDPGAGRERSPCEKSIERARLMLHPNRVPCETAVGIYIRRIRGDVWAAEIGSCTVAVSGLPVPPIVLVRAGELADYTIDGVVSLRAAYTAAGICE